MSKKHTIQDYVKWRGDLSFDQSPFNMVDSFVLCHLSYVNYSPSGIPDGEFLTLREAGKRILENNAYDLRNLNGGHQDFFEDLINSKRFGELKIGNYVDVFDPNTKIQFSAITFILDDFHRYVAFRGTDDSLTGWKEDFMLSFTKIPSQIFAQEYLAYYLEDGYQYRIGGHSKGGNLCLYAFAHLDEIKKSQIYAIDYLDGPGFHDEIIDLNVFQPYESIINKVTPTFSIIGRIFDLSLPNTMIIHADAFSISQHDLMCWNVNYLEPMISEKFDDTSTWLIESINTWAKNTPIAQREAFINKLFETLYASGVEHLQDITWKGLQKVLQAMSETDENTKIIARNLLKISLGLKPKEIPDTENVDS